LIAKDLIEAMAELIENSPAKDTGELLEHLGVAPDEVDRFVKLATFFVSVREEGLSPEARSAAIACWLDGFAIGIITARHDPGPLV
jgi:hypothetical protein